MATKSILPLIACLLLLGTGSCSTSEAPPASPPPITSAVETTTPAQVASNAQPSHLLDQIMTAIRNAESFELYSLQPGVRKGETLEKYQFQYFDWPLLGKITITHPETRRKIATAVDGMLIEQDHPGAPCFSPRHALRVTHQGNTFDLLICFECGWMRIYRNKKELDSVVIAGVQPTFDAVLKQYNVSLPDSKTQFIDPSMRPAPPPEIPAAKVLPLFDIDPSASRLPPDGANAPEELPLLDLEPKSSKATERPTQP